MKILNQRSTFDSIIMNYTHKVKLFDSKQMLLNEFSNVDLLDICDSQITELAKIRNPSIRDKQSLENAILGLKGQLSAEDFIFIYYPWKNTAVESLTEKYFIELRTSRNAYKITPEEQSLLGTKHIVVVGMSVGKAVAQLLSMERICGSITLVDFDILETTNMNRIMASITQIGMPKVVIAAREIAELDPFINVNIVEEGLTKENIKSTIGTIKDCQTVIEVCDSLEMKILLRQYCKSQHIPVVMDTSDRGMIDVERFDKEEDYPILHGKLDQFDLENIDFNDPNVKMQILLSVVDYEKVSERAKYSFSEVGKSITTWPQLSSSVYLGAASTSHVVRKILLGEKLKSGRYYIDLDLLIN